MTIPQWTLLGFAVWTLLVLISTIGITRWYLILCGQNQPREFRADEPHGSPRYRRAMRAHVNCVENLPVYGSIIFIITLLKLDNALLDVLAVTFMTARICQTITHVAFTDTNRMVLIRFAFFFTQLIIMFWMAVWAVCVASA
ncbi:hypothetical protein AQUSIP_07480 [Aquicella siphonis]|uniref:MAPEG family protein n=1 Tax=Aquicella siphonis TaxID=254247 RepID=A0A5E4PG22_9COXI|nr:MAPEG family protein [Aquicella siphonis]VVC75458.1 hypothetical protein AQUSIP_07480 [Aquicella siphonis]